MTDTLPTHTPASEMLLLSDAELLARGVPVTSIDLTGLGEVMVRIGAGGEITEIVKAGEAPVAVPTATESSN